MTAMHFNDWLTELKALFPVAEEYGLAAAIYSFQTAWSDGIPPRQAYDDFDRWCVQDDAA